MAAWFSLDKTNLSARLLPQEVEALSALKEEGQDDPLEMSSACVMAEIAGHLASAGVAVPEGLRSVPPELERAALALIVWDALGRVPGASFLLTEPRKDANDRAEKLLQRVADRKFLVTPLDTDSQTEEQPGSQGPSFFGTKKTERRLPR